MTLTSGLYTGQVYHRRSRPKVHELRYKVFTLLLDLQAIDSLVSRLWLFSRNRWNLVSFHDRDFGTGRSVPSESLTAYVERLLREHGEMRVPERILLSCYPRVLGYAFNPLSLFYCLDDQGAIYAVVHEVHNTFGERHAYVLPVADPDPGEGGPEDGWIHQRTGKSLFVSPFAHMNMHYEFRLNAPGERQVVVIKVFDDAGQWLTASYTASREPLTGARLLRCVSSQPWMTWKVTLGIHWEALRLWLKRVPWFSHVPKGSVPEARVPNAPASRVAVPNAHMPNVRGQTTNPARAPAESASPPTNALSYRVGSLRKQSRDEQ